MSKYDNNHPKHYRKRIKPVIDISDIEDDERRDPSGRKRVDVIKCLLESSSDDSDQEKTTINRNSPSILWLTFGEICHIRYVLAQTMLSAVRLNSDQQYSKLSNGDLCFRCQKTINPFFLIPSFLYSKTASRCYVCEQTICTDCSITNFIPPSSKHLFPVRVQALTNKSITSVEKNINQVTEPNSKAKIICYECSQIFEQYKISSPYSIQMPVDGFSRKSRVTTITFI